MQRLDCCDLYSRKAMRLGRVHAKRAGRLPGLPFGNHQCANYLAMVVVLPKRLRNFSTRPPMLSTDFCVPV